MADTVAVPIRKIRHVLPDTLAEIVLSAKVEADGTVHRQECPSSGAGARRQVPVLDLKPSTACESCLRAYRLGMLDRRTGPVLSDVLETLHQLKRARKVEGGDPKQILRHRDVLTAAARKLSLSAQQAALPGGDEARVRELEETCERELQRLQRLLRSPAEREAVLRKVRDDLVGPVSDAYVLDETPTLLGIQPYVEKEWNQTVTALVEQCSLRKGPLVLLVPRYVAEYVSTLRNAKQNGLQPSASVLGIDEAGAETAAHLWEPGGDGPLASLPGAALAAGSIR